MGGIIQVINPHTPILDGDPCMLFSVGVWGKISRFSHEKETDNKSRI